MNFIEALILAIIQGLTEWLPISSSGHLALLKQLFGIEASISFYVMLHLGTLIAVIYFLREEMKRLFKFDGEAKRIFAYIIIASFPIFLLGFLFKNFFESLFSNSINLALAFILNGLILYTTKFFKKRKKLNLSDSILIGIAQALSLIPGISRSGITISTAISRGIDKKTAYKFSFLLSVVAILGASLIKFSEIDFSQEPLWIVFVGILSSAFFGYIALKSVVKFIFSNEFYKFAYYCWFLGLLILLLSF